MECSMNRSKNFFAAMGVVMTLALGFCACENNAQPNPSDSFVGKYDYVVAGQVDLYAGTLKFVSVPMDNQGELSIIPGDEANTVRVIVENDTTIGHVSGDYLFLDPTSSYEMYGQLGMNMTFTYSKATLRNDSLTFKTDVDIIATFKDYDLSGKGQVDVVAVRKR